MKKIKASVRDLENKFEETAFRLTQERNDFLLPQVIDFVKTRKWLNLRPEYQRRSVWDVSKRSLFIESLLLNIPIPPVFLFEQALNRYEVMDGQQRLNAVADFYESGFALKNLEKWPELNGSRYRDLPETLKRGLDRRRISATVILAESTKKKEFTQSDVRKLVFERLNTGGQTLNAQELRNCLFAGCFNDLLTNLAGESLFTEIWKIPPYSENIDSHGTVAAPLRENSLYKRMADCEIVLRYFALKEQNRIKGSVRSMLDDCMERNQNATQEQAEEMGREYMDILRVGLRIFGKRIFQFKNAKDVWEMSIPLYDGVMIGIQRLWKQKDVLIDERADVISRLNESIKNPDIFEVIVGRPNTAKAIKARLDTITRALGGN